ncbi:MAG: hypothetical protein FJZ63_02705, partial [Chlamydiae bacterium]|nr:hypothetical protein [Chlamydiota bacterium]
FMKTTLEGLPPKLHENPPRGGQSAMTVFSFPHSAQTFIQKKIIPTPPTQKFSAYIEKELFASLLFCTQPSYFSPLEAMTEDSLIFPFYEEGDLADNCDLKHPPIATQLRRILCVIEALDTLHSQGYAHNDLKLENILVKKDSAVLTDLGFVSRFNDSHGGSLEYAAPERLLKEQISSPASDIFSLGVLLYQLFFAVHTMEEVYYRLTQNIPDSATLTEPELKKEVCRHRVTPHLYSTMRNFMATRSTTNYLLPISHPLMHLAMQCTAYIPNERPSLATIKKSINDVLTEHTDK